MVYFDIFVFAVLIFSALIGLVRGITREILGLISWGAALAASYFSFSFANTIVLQYIQNPQIAQYVTYFAVFVAFLILFSIVSSLLSSFIRQTMLSGIDRTLGFGFGLCRALFLLAVIDLGIGTFFSRDNIPVFLQDSKTISHMHGLGNQLFSVTPTWLQALIKEKQKSPTDMKNDTAEQKKSPQMLAQEQEKNAQDLASLKPQTSEPTVDSENSKAAVPTKNNDDIMNKVLENADAVAKVADTVKSLAA
jgi:membrane protein required for colicin V production